MNLEELRKEIDKIDNQIIALLNKRYEFVGKVGKWKHNNSSSFYIPEREKVLLERLQKINGDFLSNQALKAIYREILSGALLLEKELKIAFLGPKNTFSHQAAKNKFGECLSYIAQPTINAVFEAVTTKEAQYGVVPVENSIEGAVNHTLDLLVKTNCKICAELNIHPQQFLMSKDSIDKIKTIHSHPQAIGQCRQWLYRNFPNIEFLDVKSTAEGAKNASLDSSIGAIASKLCAKEYDLIIHRESIEDNKNNNTRFLILANQETKPSGKDKTSLMFEVNNRIGALKDCLECFSDLNINLTMIESRPCRETQNRHFFFIDFIGHQEDDKVKKLLETLQKQTISLKILGSFPQA